MTVERKARPSSCTSWGHMEEW